MPPAEEQSQNMGDKPCQAHGEIMESIGYIRGRIDEIADRTSRMEMRIDYSVRPPSGGNVVSVSSGVPAHAPGPLPSPRHADDGPRLLTALIALIMAVAALLGTLQHFQRQTPAATPNVVAVSPGGS